MADTFGPYRTVPMQIPTLRNTVRPVQLGAGIRPTVGGVMMQQQPSSTAQMMNARNMYAQQGLQAGAMRQAQRPKSQAELLAAYGLGPRATVAAPTRKPSMSTAEAAERAGLSGMLPAAGTPEMAGLGAAGRTLMQLGGYQDQPYTLGQILGAGAEKGIEAMQARRDAIAAAEEKKAAAEAAAEKEKYEREQKAKEYGLEERRVKAQERLDVDELFVAADRLGLKGQDAINFVKEQLAKKKGGTDVSVTIGSDGEPKMSLVKQQIKEQQDNVVKSIGTQDLLLDIQETFDEKYLQVPERINQVWLAGKDKFGVASPDEQNELKEFARFKQNAIEAVNQYIRDITGAQMSVKEAERLSLALPQPGQGIFDGDSPAVFQEKLRNAIEKVKRAEQRAKYFLSEGIDISYDYQQRSSETLDADFETDAQFKMNGKTIRLNDMPRIINKKGAEIEKELIDGGMSKEEAVKETAVRIKEIFG